MSFSLLQSLSYFMLKFIQHVTCLFVHIYIFDYHTFHGFLKKKKNGHICLALAIYVFLLSRQLREEILISYNLLNIRVYLLGNCQLIILNILSCHIFS